MKVLSEPQSCVVFIGGERWEIDDIVDVEAEWTYGPHIRFTDPRGESHIVSKFGEDPDDVSASVALAIGAYQEKVWDAMDDYAKKQATKKGKLALMLMGKRHASS